MNQKQHSSESGQVLVLLVLVIVGLLAFTALAIDGGLVFADRRGAQNAADASALAGGYRIANSLDDYQLGITMNYSDWDCDDADMTTAINLGVTLAASQSATNDYPIAGDSSLDVHCEPGEDFGSYIDKYVDTTVTIVSQVNTAFVHFAFGGSMENTVDAISRVRPRMPLAFGYAVYAHRNECNGNDGGVQVEGNPTAMITGGGIMSDACVSFQGSSITNVDNCGDDPCEINYTTNWTGGGSVSPTPTQQNYTLPEWALLFSAPDCSTLPSSSTSGDETINPGVYSGIQITGNEWLEMNPGLYCLTGDFNINGNNTSYVEGNGVTIYMIDGDFSSNGNAAVRLSAPGFVQDADDGIAGMLIYLGPDNTGEVSLAGNSESYYSGTIYGEHEDSRVQVGGTGDLSSCYEGAPCFGTQLIAGTVKIYGTATLNVNFSLSNSYYLPARLTLEK